MHIFYILIPFQSRVFRGVIENHYAACKDFEFIFIYSKESLLHSLLANPSIDFACILLWEPILLSRVDLINVDSSLKGSVQAIKFYSIDMRKLKSLAFSSQYIKILLSHDFADSIRLKYYRVCATQVDNFEKFKDVVVEIVHRERETEADLFNFFNRMCLKMIIKRDFNFFLLKILSYCDELRIFYLKINRSEYRKYLVDKFLT